MEKESQFDYPYGYFLEAKYTLNGNVSDLSASELKAVKVEYGFAYTTGAEAEEEMHVLVATRLFGERPEAEMHYREAVEPGYPQDLSIIKDLDKIISLEISSCCSYLKAKVRKKKIGTACGRCRFFLYCDLEISQQRV